MNHLNYLAGVDIGTTGTKVTVYSLDGKPVQSAYRAYSLQHLDGGRRVELDPMDWWRAVCECFQEVVREASIRASDILGIGVSGTNALIMLDSQGRPVCNAIMQLDRRAVSTIETIRTDLGQNYLLETTGNRLTHGAFWGPTLYWFQREEANTYNKVRYFLVPHSYIVFQLTDEYSIDHSRAATTLLYDIHQQSWNTELCTYFGVNQERLPEIHLASDLVGAVTTKAAELTGLRPGTPVIAGCMDTLAAHIGLNVGDREASLILGTVGRICAGTSRYDDRFMTTPHLTDHPYFSMSPVNAAGLSHRWIKSLLLEQENREDSLYSLMDQLASVSPPGARGIVYHPYIAGERSPIWDAWASGSFFGLSAFHDKGDMIRAVLEGVGYALLDNLAIYERDLLQPIDVLRAGGGGTLSTVWVQTLANILGKRIVTCEVYESETLGAAILAGVGTGCYPDVTEGMECAVHTSAEYSPDADIHCDYGEYFALYKEIYAANQHLYKKAYDLRGNNS